MGNAGKFAGIFFILMTILFSTIAINNNKAVMTIIEDEFSLKEKAAQAMQQHDSNDTNGTTIKRLPTPAETGGKWGEFDKKFENFDKSFEDF